MQSDILDRPAPAADARLKYGAGPLQFGDLRMPKMVNGAPAPLVVFLHGGWWQNAYDLTYAGHLCAALKRDGIATWSLEYRRVGDAGGGWPGTFQDAAAGFDHVAELAKTYAIDMKRVVAMGHSAGGHLAFWLAGRPHVPEASPIRNPQPKVPLRGVVSLAGAVDLRLLIDLSGYFTFAHDKREVTNFMGGTPDSVPDRYKAGDPGELLPLNVPQWLLQGTDDQQIPAQLPVRWAERGRARGEKIALDVIPGADHFDLVDPLSAAWPRVRAAVMAAVGG